MSVETIIIGDTADECLFDDKERPRRDEGEIEEEKISRTNGETRSNDDGRLSDRYPGLEARGWKLDHVTKKMMNPFLSLLPSHHSSLRHRNRYENAVLLPMGTKDER